LDLIRLLERQARVSQVRFVPQLEAVQLAADAGELGRALTNLLSNALKYAPAGTVVSVGVGATPDGVRVTVRDEGPGIPEGDLERIFASGVQARGAVDGHGLGLGIAARVAKDHRGTIWAENDPAGGARFVLELPG
jgi:signal transduction histidine kinase